jgi:hypothetical protein
LTIGAADGLPRAKKMARERAISLHMRKGLEAGIFLQCKSLVGGFKAELRPGAAVAPVKP